MDLGCCEREACEEIDSVINQLPHTTIKTYHINAFRTDDQQRDTADVSQMDEMILALNISAS